MSCGHIHCDAAHSQQDNEFKSKLLKGTLDQEEALIGLVIREYSWMGVGV